MHKDFWLERWQKEQIGFHQNEVNPHLHDYWQSMQLPRGGEVFVPLCGKSLDMRWLRQQGHAVLGVELSPVAVAAFFAENSYMPQQDKQRAFELSEADEIRILCGDFFALTPEDMAHVQAVYDRAALVALPHEMRTRYVRHLVSILPSAAQILLITFDYPQAQMSGPPFAVSADEVESLFGPYAQVRKLAELDVLEQNPRFRDRGLSRLHEHIFHLTLG